MCRVGTAAHPGSGLTRTHERACGAYAGVTAWLAGEGEDISQWEADITGPADSPYERGIFRLEIVLPER